ncbi:GNAT family N-acetyltransferase [uncultured Tateyamaria sp.]|uniref:GNAT family N-acetyltransferase n=1 Tax=uncultured Tateyamaria sp. TaxID=455651 RepID=UPI00260D4D89|nr:GNAT family N-acetyltransferase [uncultured Tateyamaria sp.]
MTANAPRVRPLVAADTDAALRLYNELTFGPATQDTAAFAAVLAHPGTTVFGAEHDGDIRAMVTLHLMPNVTWNARPYGLIENVVTAAKWRGHGLGKAVLTHAVHAAWAQNAYKVMLMTGTKRGAMGFYESVGFSSEDKHAMVIRQN